MSHNGGKTEESAPYRDSTSSDRYTVSDSGDLTSELHRTSAERQHYDRKVLDEEDEREELLTGQPRKEASSSKTRKRRKARKSGHDVEDKKELLYDRDVEDGVTNSRRSSASNASSVADREKIGNIQAHQKRPSRIRNCCKYGILNVIIAAIFVGIAYGAFRATRADDVVTGNLVSNGTELFAPTTIVVSLDGFRADFLHRGLTPTLNLFIKQGVSPEYMLPSFPSVTFPNHYTLATGLYPESHGVVGNTFWDPEIKEEFYYTHPSAMHAKWWGGEPLWVTAEKQRVRTGIHMWPGSEAHIGRHVEPSFLDKFNGSEALSRKVDRILGLLDRPSPDQQHMELVVKNQRPQLIMAYVPNVDADGHKFGPNSTEIRETIQEVDTMLAHIFEGLEERNLTDIVNVVVVSDHGMATTSLDRLIQFEDLVDPKYFDHIDGWPLYGLRPKDDDMLDMLYDHLVKESDTRQGFDVYLRDSDMPEHYHFSNNDRIAPLWIVPHTGWAIVTLDEFDIAAARESSEVYHPRGLHGYDHEHPLMRSIFVARGPAFPHEPGSKVDVFQNIEVYNILCDSVGVEPKPNNGTVRLPLMTTGKHSDEDLSRIDDHVADPPPPPPSKPTEITRPVIDKPDDTTDFDLNDESSWPDWFRKQIESVKGWLDDLFGLHKANASSAANSSMVTSSSSSSAPGTVTLDNIASTASTEQPDSLRTSSASSTAT